MGIKLNVAVCSRFQCGFRHGGIVKVHTFLYAFVHRNIKLLIFLVIPVVIIHERKLQTVETFCRTQQYLCSRVVLVNTSRTILFLQGTIVSLGILYVTSRVVLNCAQRVSLTILRHNPYLDVRINGIVFTFAIVGIRFILANVKLITPSSRRIVEK